MDLKIRKQVLVPLKNARSFFGIRIDEGPHGGVLLPLRSGLDVGEAVDLEFTVASSGLVFTARGIVRWRRLQQQGRLRAGVGVEFLPSTACVCEVLEAWANGQPPPYLQRRSRRYGVEIAVTVQTENGWQGEGVTDNLSLAGCLVAVAEPPRACTKVTLELCPAEDCNLVIEGNVVWVRRGESPGFGTQFGSLDANTGAELKALVQTIKARIASGLGSEH